MIGIMTEALMPETAIRFSGYEVSISGYSILLLILHLVSVPVLVLLAARAELLVSLPVIVVWLVLLYLKYRGIFSRFRKPLMWSKFLLIIAIAALFRETGCGHYLFSARRV